MKSPLDTSELQRLCELVAKHAKEYNASTIPKAKDESWSQLVSDSLPQLEQFITNT